MVYLGFLLLAAFIALSIVVPKLRASLQPGEDTLGVNSLAVGQYSSLAGGLLLIIGSSIVVVDPGHRGVQITFGNINPQAIPEGFHFVNPFSKVMEMEVRIVADEGVPHTAETADTQTVSVAMTTIWRPDPEMMPSLYQRYGLSYADKIIVPAVKECIKAEVAKHKITDLVTERPAISANVGQTIGDWVREKGLILEKCAIADIDFSDKYDHAIEEKQAQEQIALQKQYELERTQTEAKMAQAEAEGRANAQIENARGQAESVKLKAQAEAEALRIRAEAQAEYNRKVSESLTGILVQNNYVQKWDGAVPTYQLGNGSNTMLMLPSVTK